MGCDSCHEKREKRRNPDMKSLFSVDNPKSSKSTKYGFLNGIHYLAPATLAGVGNVCGHESEGCKSLCLGQHSGAAVIYSRVLQSRVNKTIAFMRDRLAYMDAICKGIESVERQAKREDMRLAIRFNGSSDIAIEGIKCRDGQTILQKYRNLQFMDYTKSYKRMLRYLSNELPTNYHITFSRTESNEHLCRDILRKGGNVAVVFANGLPSSYMGHHVINGDNNDLRFLDPMGVVVGLTPKGWIAKRDRSGFVIRDYEIT
jgi:hypothetical protein